MSRQLHRGFFSLAILMVAIVCNLVYETAGVLEDHTQVIKKIPTAHKVVALTVDDGPHGKVTPELLRLLQEKGVKATFFMLGANVEKHPEIVKQVIDNGHEIACHSYSHKRLNTLTTVELNQEFEQFEALLQNLSVPKPVFFRPPDGAYNDAVVALAYQRGYKTILWSVDAGDWRCPPVQQVVQVVLQQVKPGAIILMHDGQYPLPTTPAVGLIIDKLRSQGYQFLTMSELMQYDEQRQ